MSATTTSPILIDSNKVGFDMPVYLPQERSIIANPMSLITDFYNKQNARRITPILRDITFQLRAGERLAVIGQNGSGKSTLLRLVGGIYKPSSGSLTLKCTPHGMFDIATGFVPNATGLENVYLRGLEMGLSMRQIREKIPEMVMFSGLEDSIDKPFNSYSAGMRLRLAVAIALSVQPDVMLLDEWIGAGDAVFQIRVTNRMNELVDGARGLMLASHNDTLLRRVCTHGIVMHKGSAIFVGPLSDALKFYHTEYNEALKAERAAATGVSAISREEREGHPMTGENPWRPPRRRVPPPSDDLLAIPGQQQPQPGQNPPGLRAEPPKPVATAPAARPPDAPPTPHRKADEGTATE